MKSNWKQEATLQKLFHEKIIPQVKQIVLSLKDKTIVDISNLNAALNIANSLVGN
jgi:hypothetical protein